MIQGQHKEFESAHMGFIIINPSNEGTIIQVQVLKHFSCKLA